VVCGSQSHAFEQGNYYIFDLVESSRTEAIAGRLAIPKKTLSHFEAKPKQTESSQRSEFEIDYSKSIQATKANSAFNLETPMQAKPTPKNVSFSTESYDFESSRTVFGE
jgi:hypothetical protein